MDRKQMITYAIIAIIVILIVWLGAGMIGGGGESETTVVPNPDIPKTASLLPKQQTQQSQQPMSEREMQLVRLQQETQAKYLAALNELQMLKVEKDIAETNRDVSKANLEKVTAQKGIVDLLAPPKPAAPNYAQGLVAPGTPTAPTTTSTPSTTAPEVQAGASDDYKVVSVSRLRGQWVAVLGMSGALYSVKMGDVLPADGSVVSAINRDGIVLEKDGKSRKLSMVPII